MAFKKEVQLKGDTNQYQISPELKIFTLRDLGFTKTRNDNFEKKLALDPTSPYLKKSVKLKIMINQDLTTFKMAIVDGSELKEIDIFSNDKFASEREQFDFAMQDFISRKIFVKR